MTDQPVRIIALHTLGSQTSKLSLNERQRFCLEYVDAQGDQSLRWVKCNAVRNAVPRLIY